MKISITVLNNGLFEELGIWSEWHEPNEEKKEEAINLISSIRGYYNKNGVTFILAKIAGLDTLTGIKGDRVLRYEGEAIQKFKSQCHYLHEVDVEICL